MSFATGRDVMQCTEGVVQKLWTDLLGANSTPLTFPQMTYEDAMTKYGSDKPDVRLGMEVRYIILDTLTVSRLTV